MMPGDGTEALYLFETSGMNHRFKSMVLGGYDDGYIRVFDAENGTSPIRFFK